MISASHSMAPDRPGIPLMAGELLTDDLDRIGPFFAHAGAPQNDFSARKSPMAR